MTLTSKNSCLPALLLPVPVNLFLDFFLFVFLKQLFTQRVGRDFRPRLEKETLGSFGAGVPLPFNERVSSWEFFFFLIQTHTCKAFYTRNVYLVILLL